MRTLGAFSNASDLNPSQTYGYVNLKNSFDTLIFVETMHPAHSFQVGRAAAVRPVTVPSGAGGVSWPTKWFVAGSDPADYSVGGDAPGATYPAGLLWLSSVSSTGYGVTAGTIPVARYLGKRISSSAGSFAFSTWIAAQARGYASTKRAVRRQGSIPCKIACSREPRHGNRSTLRWTYRRTPGISRSDCSCRYVAGLGRRISRWKA